MSESSQKPLGVLEIEESDEVGRLENTYLITESDGKGTRIDIVPTSERLPLAQRLLAVFLPTGYPHSVSSDYKWYQIYDSLQAFSSSIAGLLASRAVLQGIGVGDQNASATAAMLLSVLQESMGQLATILFAHWAAKRIEVECKMYRLAADCFNDMAFMIDCLSPSLPKPIRVPLFCISSMSRAICGVAGGSSKAILSAHFARSDNIGELNVKDSSQETVISLLGMWAGGFVVSRVHGNLATWIWLICLLTVHLATNYAAVRAVRMTTLNRQRANVVFSHMLDKGTIMGPDAVADQERIFERDGILRWKGTEVLGSCQIGVTVRTLLKSLPGQRNDVTLSHSHAQLPIVKLMAIFKNEQYLLWFDGKKRRAIDCASNRGE